MTTEFDRYFKDAWQKAKTPLERQWDAMMPDWEDRTEEQTDKIRRNHGGLKLRTRDTGMPVRCHLCGSTDGWRIENEEPHATPVAVCDHGLASGVIRRISSIRADQVYSE